MNHCECLMHTCTKAKLMHGRNSAKGWDSTRLFAFLNKSVYIIFMLKQIELYSFVTLDKQLLFTKCEIQNQSQPFTILVMMSCVQVCTCTILRTFLVHTSICNIITSCFKLPLTCKHIDVYMYMFMCARDTHTFIQ